MASNNVEENPLTEVEDIKSEPRSLMHGHHREPSNDNSHGRSDGPNAYGYNRDNSHEGMNRGGGPGGFRGMRGNYGGGRGGMRGRGGYRGGGRQGGGMDDNRGPPGLGRGQEMRINERLQQIQGPTVDLPSQDVTEKKFSGRCRLYVGNLPPDTTDDEINELFKTYGETNEVFVNREKFFAFIRLDYRHNAEKAKRELDGFLRKGRPLKVRYAPNSAALKVKNLSPWVSNELLERAFGVFGDIEKATVCADDRGKPTGEGVVEFTRRPSAMMALKYCQEGSFFLTSTPRPVIVEPLENNADDDGFQERNIIKKSPDYLEAREVGPRFASPGSFQFEYGQRWKQLYELKKQKEDALVREMQLETEKLEAQMEYARYEHETEMLREQLRQREMDRDRQKQHWEMKDRQHDELRQDEELLRRRQQDNSLFMQTQHHSRFPADENKGIEMSNPEEQQMRGSGTKTFDMTGGSGDSPGGTPNMGTEGKPFMEGFDRYDQGSPNDGHGGNMRDGHMRGGGGRGMRGGGRWGREDDFQNKRRRF